MKLSHLSQAAVNSLNELQTVYTDDTKLCCILENIQGCHEYKGNNRKCFQLLSHPLMRPMLIFFAITILIFILISMWFVAKLFAVSKPIQYLLHNVILINRSLCLLYVVSIVIIDAFYGKHYTLWYGSLVNRFVCQGLVIMFSSGLVMSNIATSVLDHIAHMATTLMFFNKNDKNPMLKVILFSLHVLILTGFSVITLLVEGKMYCQLSANNLCSAPLGLPLDEYSWKVIGPVFLFIVILFSLTHSIYAHISKLKNAYSSGRRVLSMASTEMNTHKKKLLKLTKTISLSITFRSLECLPILCVIFLNVYGRDITFGTELMSIITAIMLGCIGGTLPLVWFPMFSQKRT